jgi:hypothetical protein
MSPEVPQKAKVRLTLQAMVGYVSRSYVTNVMDHNNIKTCGGCWVAMHGCKDHRYKEKDKLELV